jgi:hypothetical protein
VNAFIGGGDETTFVGGGDVLDAKIADASSEVILAKHGTNPSSWKVVELVAG